MTAQAFGDMLRRHRERRGISVKAVADQTKIAPSMLAALERGDCSKWPGGIYSRAWIRAYAAAVGLDPDDIGGHFNRLFAHNAFLEGETAGLTVAPPADIPRITPLRMTFEPDSSEAVRLVVRRVLFLLADLAIAAAGAAAAALAAAVGFWTAFALAAVACHALGLIGGGGSATGWIVRAARRHARAHEGEAEPAVAEAA